MSYHEPTVQEALDVLYKRLTFHVQKLQNGIWLNATKTPITGKDAAYNVMGQLRSLDANEGQKWRVIPRNEADAYMAGLRDAQPWKYGRRRHQKVPSRSLIYLPDNL